jgi:hypothetical protein
MFLDFTCKQLGVMFILKYVEYFLQGYVLWRHFQQYFSGRVFLFILLFLTENEDRRNRSRGKRRKNIKYMQK